MAERYTPTIAIDHFTVHFFFMKCECVATGHIAQIVLFHYLFLAFNGSIMAMTMATMAMTVVAMEAMAMVVIMADVGSWSSWSWSWWQQ